LDTAKSKSRARDCSGNPFLTFSVKKDWNGKPGDPSSLIPEARGRRPALDTIFAKWRQKSLELRRNYEQVLDMRLIELTLRLRDPCEYVEKVECQIGTHI